MSGLLSIEVQCEKCDSIFGILVDRDKRNEPVHCDVCEGGMARRIWSVPNVSTAKTSVSMPDGVGRGRFDDLRYQRQAQTELAKAKQAYASKPSDSAKEEIRRARKEKQKLKPKK